MSKRPDSRRGPGVPAALPVVAGLLVAATALLYLPAVHYPYNGIDDLSMVEQNPLVRGGAAWGTLARNLFSVHDGYWIPLTWFSFFLEIKAAGVRPALSHATNIAIHAANVVLLLALLVRLAGRLWPAVLAASVFAVHPAHVESVVWIAERKDVLSTLLGLGAAYTYVGWARGPRDRLPGATLALYALSLLAKPMLAALPLLLLLLDYWPLGRFRAERGRALVAEKLPLLLPALAFGILTVVTQSAHFTNLGVLGLGSRTSYALVAPLFYLGKLLAPYDLAFVYPVRVTPYPLWLVVLSPLLVAAATWWAVRRRLRQPYLLTGWLWYLVTLAPVSGIVKAGLTIVMDRVVYVPVIGLHLALIGVAGAVSRRPGRQRRAAVVAAVAAVALLTATGVRQIGYWRDDCTLFARTVAVTPDSVTAQWKTMICLLDRGEDAQALEHALAARGLVPQEGEMAYNLGIVYGNLQRYPEAIAAYEQALALGERGVKLQSALGVALGSVGRTEEGLGHLREARRLDPAAPSVAYNLGVALLRLGRAAEAVEPLEASVRLAPADPKALHNLQVARRQAALGAGPAAGAGP